MGKKNSQPPPPPPVPASPAESAITRNALAFDDWRMGRSGPIDVNKMPGGGVGIDLFNKAKMAKDSGRIGQGLAYSENANPSFSKAIDKENELARGLQASGDLENYVTGKEADADRNLYGSAGLENSRNESNQDRAMQVWLKKYEASQRPSALKNFLLGLAGNVSYAPKALAGLTV